MLGDEYILYGVINNEPLSMKVDMRSKVQPHTSIEICFDLSKIHIFDDGTGESIIEGSYL